ncbi:mandelate racemase/muconate lactonizing enzyme family protein [Aurantimonas sp. VKM B-3413]|uniref:mandelate racemase/muconate lactonizing enzyme family protein n=1 Tax=Aurantimonas sp. VKM B-3413 TaxID=2779401 RepID=UPI001E295F28|nr:mandelate racemase/muconate lactonizing enzyme family protein [Aurantimonas sp. VKM B-3413]
MTNIFEIAAVEPHVYRVPIAVPVVTSFGTMHDRPALFVRVVGADGAEGWGEVWCNFPAVGAEHRARLILSVLVPLILGKRFEEPRAAFGHLTARTEVLAIQSGEPGPLAQAIAGLDIAVHDMLARRAGEPLHRFLGGGEAASVPAYASGLNADAPEILAQRKFDEGYRRFKVKVGFGRDRDIGNLKTLRETFGPDTPIMVDANQAWGFDEALAMAEAFAEYRPLWLEEPMRADRPITDWTRLAAASPVPLANGENLRGTSGFAEMVEAGGIAFLQPDIGKWGGLSGGLPVARHAQEHGVTLCPHWLGGGIGLVASLHYLAAIGGEGVLEVDANPNPLRDKYVTGFPEVSEGAMAIPAGAGLGIAPDLAALRRYRVDI